MELEAMKSEMTMRSLPIKKKIENDFKGLEYIHTSFMHAHKHLKAQNCVIDSRWVLKIDDFGLENLRGGQNSADKEKSWFYIPK